jgi:hypothetical protein
MYYAGIGSRGIDYATRLMLNLIGREMANAGWTLRSGGAPGADQAFEEGCNAVAGDKEIYLPWKGFENNLSSYYPPTSAAYDVGKKYHPQWKNLSESMRNLMARNSHQVLGWNIGSTPASDVVICWTADGSEGETTPNTGGTGQAIRIAHDLNIPIINLKKDDAFFRIGQLIGDDVVELIKKEVLAASASTMYVNVMEGAPKQKSWNLDVLE